MDETVVLPDDEEVLQDEKTDEFASYFESRLTPKVLLLTVRKPSGKTVLLMNELNKCIPNSEFRYVGVHVYTCVCIDTGTHTHTHTRTHVHVHVHTHAHTHTCTHTHTQGYDGGWT